MQTLPQPLTRERAIAFILGGRALVVFHNTQTDNRHTFTVRRQGKTNQYWVNTPRQSRPIGQIFIGADNRPLLTIKVTDNEHVSNEVLFKHKKVFQWVFIKLLDGTLPPYINIYHNGRCGVCGRPLTDPESIANGTGPICEKRIARFLNL